MNEASRGFPREEFAGRLARAQKRMLAMGIETLLLTSEADFRYFTGFLTRFWESTTRPWFLVVPSHGAPIAVIPSIGAALMRETWIEDIRTWNAPDPEDDGVTLVAAALAECAPAEGRIALPSHGGTSLRMPLADFEALKNRLSDRRFTDDESLVAELRMGKSPAEIAKIRNACRIAGRAFGRMVEIAGKGVPLSEVFRRFQMICLEEGGDWVGYLAGGAGPDGYLDVIRPADESPLRAGDVLMLDTGVVWDGYYCDFDRNFSIGEPSKRVCDSHRRLIEATEAGFGAARPGALASDLFVAMDEVLTGGAAPEGAGRLGHGLGLQLTEPPSLMPGDGTVIAEGMVLTLEPWITTGDGRILVHEENILVTETGAEWLTQPASADLPVIS